MKQKISLQRLRTLSWWKKVLVAIGAIVGIFLLIMAIRSIHHYCWQKNHPCDDYYDCFFEYENTTPECWLSSNVTFRKSDYNCDGFLYNERTHQIINSLIPLRWVQTNNDDSLAIGAIAGRRGFFDRFTGEQVLPFDYTRAWFFSEGVAAVTDTLDNLFFIDKKGDRAINKTFRYSPSMRYEGYMFHGGYCIMNDSIGRKGIIDQKGEWALNPVWDMIVWRKGFWVLRRNDSIQLIDIALHTLVPKMKATESRLYHDGNILVEIPNKPSRLYSMQGRLVSDKVFADVIPLLYRADHQVSPFDTCYSELKPSACSMYINMAGECGLMDKNGHILTDAIYYDIKALDYGLFRAQVTFYPNDIYIMLGANGKEIR